MANKYKVFLKRTITVELIHEADSEADVRRWLDKWDLRDVHHSHGDVVTDETKVAGIAKI